MNIQNPESLVSLGYTIFVIATLLVLFSRGFTYKRMILIILLDILSGFCFLLANSNSAYFAFTSAVFLTLIILWSNNKDSNPP